jgi:hypothetical protein
MSTITIKKSDLKSIIQKSVREAIDQEFMKVRAIISPFASPKEQQDIEKRCHRPSRQIAKTIEIEI